MIIAVDVGYSHTKVMAANGRQAIFPSVAGEVNKVEFEFGDRDDYIQITFNGAPYFVGQAALEQSRFNKSMQRDRFWWKSKAYLSFFLAAVSEMTSATNVAVQLVSGLPVLYFSDKDAWRESYVRRWTFRRNEQPTQNVQIEEALILPQGLAAVLSVAMDDSGRITDEAVANGRVGLIDIGGHTTNLATFDKLKPVVTQTGSADQGMWDFVLSLEPRINSAFPGLNLRGHGMLPVIESKSIRSFGKDKDVSGIIDDVAEHFTEQMESEINRIWGNAASLDKLFIAGGGGRHLAGYIKAKFANAVLVDDAQWANARGYLKYGIRTWKGG